MPNVTKPITQPHVVKQEQDVLERVLLDAARGYLHGEQGKAPRKESAEQEQNKETPSPSPSAFRSRLQQPLLILAHVLPNLAAYYVSNATFDIAISILKSPISPGERCFVVGLFIAIRAAPLYVIFVTLRSLIRRGYRFRFSIWAAILHVIKSLGICFAFVVCALWAIVILDCLLDCLRSAVTIGCFEGFCNVWPCHRWIKSITHELWQASPVISPYLVHQLPQATFTSATSALPAKVLQTSSTYKLW